MSDRLRAIAARWAKIGKTGNWSARQDHDMDTWAIYTDDAWPGETEKIEAQLGEIYSKHEAEFVAAAPSDIAWLIAEVKRSRAASPRERAPSEEK